MSYRNDHDAAIARVDALTHQLDQTEEERDHLQAEVEQLRSSSPQPAVHNSKVAVGVIAMTIGICAAVLSPHHRASPPSPPPDRAAPEAVVAAPPAPRSPAAVPAPRASPADRITDAGRVKAVIACAERVQRATAENAARTDLRPLRASCRAELASLVQGRAISPEARGLLARWLAVEDRLSPSLAAYNTYILRDPEGTRYRAPVELRDEFEAALRARDAILPELRDTLQRLEIEPSPGELAHAAVEPPALTTGK